jgi:hypothetical protein
MYCSTFKRPVHSTVLLVVADGFMIGKICTGSTTVYTCTVVGVCHEGARAPHKALLSRGVQSSYRYDQDLRTTVGSYMCTHVAYTQGILSD